MDYKSVIGERIKRLDEVEGRIVSVDEQGTIELTFDDNRSSGGYLYDPFLRGEFKFVKEELQSQIDTEIAHFVEKQRAIIMSKVVSVSGEETYRITQANEEGVHEVILLLNCTEQEARMAFGFYIREEEKYMHECHKWRQLRLIEAKTGKCIGQES